MTFLYPNGTLLFSVKCQNGYTTVANLLEKHDKYELFKVKYV